MAGAIEADDPGAAQRTAPEPSALRSKPDISPPPAAGEDPLKQAEQLLEQPTTAADAASTALEKRPDISTPPAAAAEEWDCGAAVRVVRVSAAAVDDRDEPVPPFEALTLANLPSNASQSSTTSLRIVQDDMVITDKDELKGYLNVTASAHGGKRGEFTRHLLRAIFMGNIQDVEKAEEALAEGKFSDSMNGTLVEVATEGWVLRCQMLVKGVVFNRAVYFTIVALMVYRMFYTPQDPYSDPSGADDTFLALEALVTGFFSIELLIRLVAHGNILSFDNFFFVNGRNLFDLLIVVTSLAALATAKVDRGSVATWAFFPLVLRCFRFFRPFKPDEFGELRVIADNIFESLPMMKNVLVLTFIFFLGFAVTGVYSFEGSLQDYCVVAADSVRSYPIIHCSMQDSYHYSARCPSGMTCARTGVVLPDGTDVSGNPEGGYLSFDHLGTALLTVLTASSREGWVNIMYWELTAVGPLAIVYFVVLILFVSQFVVALFMAALCDIFGSGDQMRSLRSAVLSYKDDKSMQLFEDKLDQLVEDADSQTSRANSRANSRAVTERANEIADAMPQAKEWATSKLVEAMTVVTREQDNLKSAWEYKRLHTRWNPDANRERSNAAKADTGSTSGKEGKNEIENSSAEFAILTRTASKIQDEAHGLRQAAAEAHSSEQPQLVRTASVMLERADQTEELAGQLLEQAQKTATVRDYLELLVNSVEFEMSALFIILAILVVAVIETSIDEDADMQETLRIIDSALSALFVLEACLRILATRSLTGYFADGHNRLEFVLALVSLIELLTQSTEYASSFRLLRLTGLARCSSILFLYPAFRQQIQTAFKSAHTLLHLFAMIAMLLFVYASLGNSIFYKQYDGDLNFNNFGSSCLTMFVCFTGEDWHVPFYALAQEQPFSAIAFFSTYYVLSVWVFMQLIVAVFLENFQQNDKEKFKQARQIKEQEMHKKIMSSTIHYTMMAVSKLKGLLGNPKLKRHAKVAPAHEAVIELGPTRSDLGLRGEWFQSLQIGTQRLVNTRWWKLFVVLLILANTVTLAVLNPDSSSRTHFLFDTVFLALFGFEFVAIIFAWGFVQPVCEEQIILRAKKKASEWYQDIDKGRVAYADVADEMKENELRMNAASRHLRLHRADALQSDRYIHQPYVQETKNLLDFAVLILLLCNVLHYSVTNESDSTDLADGLRTTRVLRTLRIVGAFKALKLFQGTTQVMEPLQAMLPETLPTAGLVIIFTFLMSILGVKLFRNTLKQCTDISATSESACSGIYLNEMFMMVPRKWANPLMFNFDRLDSGFLALCQIISLEGWNDLMFITMDRTMWAASLFYLLFVLIACLIFMQLFQGVVITKFNEKSATDSLTWRQKVWEDTKSFINKNKTSDLVAHHIKQHARSVHFMAHGSMSLAAEPTIMHRVWGCIVSLFANDVFSVCTVGVHFCFFASYHFDQSNEWTATLFVVDWIFLVVYVLEIAAKIYTIKWVVFWVIERKIDTFTVVVFGVELVATSIIGNSLGSIWAALHAARLIRFCTIFFNVEHGLSGIKMVLVTFVMSLKSWLSYLVILSIVCFVWVVVGRELFWTVKFGRYHNGDANFQTFGSSAMTLFRMITGEQWPYIMTDLMVQAPGCTVDQDCGSVVNACFFFFSFYFVVVCVLWQLITAIILRNFSFCYNALITEHDLLLFSQLWARYCYLLPDDKEHEYVNEVTSQLAHDKGTSLTEADTILSPKTDENDGDRLYTLTRTLSAGLDEFDVALGLKTRVVDTGAAESRRVLKWNRMQPKKKTTDENKQAKVRTGFSSLVPEMMPAEGVKAGFIEMKNLRAFLLELGPPLSQTNQSKEVSMQAYSLVYAEMEEMSINYGGHLNFWHVLQVLIVKRLGFDGLSESRESPDRAHYMERMHRVLHRQLAAEKIQSAFVGLKVRQNLAVNIEKTIGRRPTSEEISLVTKIREHEVVKVKKLLTTPQEQTRERPKEIASVWRSSIESCIKRSERVVVTDGSQNLLSHQMQGRVLCLNHPIVLMKSYTLTMEEDTFDVKRLEKCIQRVLEATNHSEVLKHELAALTLRLLCSQGLETPHILDIRAILTKVCQQIIQFRG